MTNCTCGAGHATFGACLRAKNIRVGYCQSARGLDLSSEKAKERELASYAAARRQGVQPASTFTKDIHHAMDVSDRMGAAFDAATGPRMPGV
jgi:hypothetical protein